MPFQSNSHLVENNHIQYIEQCQLKFQEDGEHNHLLYNFQNVEMINESAQLSQSPSSERLSSPNDLPRGSTQQSTNKKFKCQCEICFKEFGHKSNLFIHMRTHNGERPYKCTQCAKSFTHSGNLAIHMRTHSGERPYKCQICGKMFSHSGNLSTHLRTHSGVKPYKCNICGKEFRHSGNLSIHERIHSGIKPFQCKICGKEFYHSGNLTTHMKKHSISKDIDANKHENNGKQTLCITQHLNDSISLNPVSNTVIVTTDNDNKLLSTKNIVPVKSEYPDESTSNNYAIIPSNMN